MKNYQHDSQAAQLAKLTEAKAAEKLGRRARHEGKVAEAIETYDHARDLYAATGLQYGEDEHDVMRAIKRCNAIVSNLRHPKEKRPPTTTPRSNCLSCSKPLPRFRLDGRTYSDGTPREWGAYGDQRFCSLTCGWRWACAHAPMPPRKS